MSVHHPNRPLRAESIAPLTRRVPRALLFRGFAARNPDWRRRLAVIENYARWHGRALVVVHVEVKP